MNENYIQELRQCLRDLHNEILHIESLLRLLGVPMRNFIDSRRLSELEEFVEQLEKAEQIYHALARLDFHDDYYSVIRAIDGDTIVVEAPTSLKSWMEEDFHRKVRARSVLLIAGGKSNRRHRRVGSKR